MQVVILVGGKGTRLRPITEKTPKPMVEINGIPFLEILLKILREKSITNVVLCIGYLSEIIENYFQDGKKFKISIKYSKEKELLGTAGAIKNAEKLLEDEFIVLNGDTFVSIDYQNLINFSRQKGKLITISGYLNDEKNKDFFNNLLIDPNSNVTKYSKERKNHDMNSVDVGVYYFKKKALKFFKGDGPLSLELEIFPQLISQNQVAGFPIQEKFYDIGTLSRLKKFSDVCKELRIK